MRPWRALRARVLGVALCVLLTPTAAAEPRFAADEIRVIKPRFMSKRGRVELTAGLATIVNQSFIYSFLATGMLSYHVSETIGAELQGGYAVTADRAEKTRLNDRFGIKAILLRPESVANGRIMWTPSYGKFHLSAARIVYFDSYVAGGGGMTGVRYLYDYCEGSVPAARSKAYPTAILGVGQRYFLDRSTGVRVGLDLQRVFVDAADGQCLPGGEHKTEAHDNLLFFAAWSHYL